MVLLDQVEPNPESDADESSTAYTATATPPETIAAEDQDLLDDDYDPFSGGGANPTRSSSSSSSIPWPGSTFIIRSVTSGHVITLLNGQIALDPPSDHSGSTHWACVESKGWLGFRSPVSGRLLGHDKDGKLCCSAGWQQMWENFCVRMSPKGEGYVLLMTHWERLWPVGIIVDKGVEKLAKIGSGVSDGMVWEFIKV